MTFSIVARCPRTGMLGIGSSSKAFAVGSVVPWVQGGVGAIASQSFTNPYLGIDGLRLLEQGLPAERALEQLIEADPGRLIRQVGIVDRDGRSAAYTGEKCIEWAGQVVGGGYVALGNMLTGDEVVKQMAVEFERSADESLEERLVSALEAGQEAGGDRRGRQSAAIYVASTEEYGWCDLRVDDHRDPVAELRRIYDVWKQEREPFMIYMPRRDDPVPAWDAVMRVRDQMGRQLEEATAKES
jgi:uncharacterized Ntn-hydrolase superfamily protein